LGGQRLPLHCTALDATSPTEVALQCLPGWESSTHAHPTLQVAAEASEAKLQMAEAQVSKSVVSRH